MCNTYNECIMPITTTAIVSCLAKKLGDFYLGGILAYQRCWKEGFL